MCESSWRGLTDRRATPGVDTRSAPRPGRSRARCWTSCCATTVLIAAPMYNYAVGRPSGVDRPSRSSDDSGRATAVLVLSARAHDLPGTPGLRSSTATYLRHFLAGHLGVTDVDTVVVG